jgi:ketosteroid isomerase-like protein
VTGALSEPPNNLRVVQNLYAAFRAPDLDAVHALLAPDVVFDEDAPAPFGGRYIGHAGFGELMAKFAAAPGHVEFETRGISAAADHVFALNDLHRVGLDRHAEVGELFHLRAGKIVHLHVLPLDRAAWQRFWA